MKEQKNFIENFITNIKDAKEYLLDIKEIFDKREQSPELSLNTLPVFNRKIWGLKNGLTILGGRTSQGKSALSLQIAYDLARQGHPVWFVSLEMNVESLIERLFCNIMMIDNYQILTGHINQYETEWQDFINQMDIPLKLSCGIGKDFEEINQSVELLEPKPKVIILDYIQAIRNFGDERQNLNEYIRKFRELCIQNDIAGVLCSQVSRKIFEEGNKEPSLYNLKGTGGLEELADCVILLHWQYFYDAGINKNDFKVIIAKQRNGRIGEHILHYEPQFYKFSDVIITEGIKNIIEKRLDLL